MQGTSLSTRGSTQDLRTIKSSTLVTYNGVIRSKLLKFRMESSKGVTLLANWEVRSNASFSVNQTRIKCCPYQYLFHHY